MSEDIEWFVSISGPDEIQTCESEEDARKQADKLNEWFGKIMRDEEDDLCLKATVGFRRA